MAYAAGHSLPVDSYAMNNPVAYVDNDGYIPRRPLAYWLMRLYTFDPSNPIARPPSDPEVQTELKKKTSKKKSAQDSCPDKRPDNPETQVWKREPIYVDRIGWLVPNSDGTITSEIPWTPVVPIPSLSPYVPLPPLPTLPTNPIPVFP